MDKNLILITDSYKFSHKWQYPPDTNAYFGYIESRGGMFEKTTFFGLQMYLKEYLSQKITMDNIIKARKFTTGHGVPYNEDGWIKIVEEYDGRFPITIKAVPEGLTVPVHNVVTTIEVTEDPDLFWLGSYLETALLRGVWFPTTVCTYGWHCKQNLKHYMNISCDNLDGLKFKLHDFGARGSSCHEEACLGGAAHVVNFEGSDTVEGVNYANEMYDIEMSAFSISAAEHSTITAWGEAHEVDAYRNMLDQFAKPGSIVAVVSDSYDIINACDKIWGIELRQRVIDSGATIVIRPDSGDPVKVNSEIIEILGRRFGYSVNKKGYKLLNYVRLIQGDGMDIDSMSDVCEALMENKWSIDNINFGMGGNLIHNHTRDDQQFAMKCSAVRINDKWREVCKHPVTDSAKKSKSGRLSLYRIRKDHDNGFNYITKRIDDFSISVYDEVLRPVYVNGNIVNTSTFKEVRERASLQL